jgi:phospholipid/cholesterol/gamma-HCH transport system substrate-binding protein
MTSLQSRVPSSAYKVGIFAVITAVLIGLLATLIGNISFAASHTYYGVFSDATGVFQGDRVRISGVEVGSVTGLDLVEQGNSTLARISFTVDSDVPVYRDATLQLRYENIVGQRYLNIVEQPENGGSAPSGSVFGLARTVPALNLTQLFNGFQPLFRALDPQQLNTFSYELVRALQGEGGTLAGLMQDTAQLTNTLADKDAVIGGVVSNLNDVLATVGARDQKLTDLIVQFRGLMSGLASSSQVIGASLPSLDRLLSATSGTLAEIRAPLKQSIAGLGSIAGSLDADRSVLDASLQKLPFTLRTLARTGSYGSWFNFYVCGLQLNLTLLEGTVTLQGVAAAANERNTVCAGGVG